MGISRIESAALLAGSGTGIVLLIRAVGARRVLWGLVIVVYLAFAVAFKMIGVIVGGRRY